MKWKIIPSELEELRWRYHPWGAARYRCAGKAPYGEWCPQCRGKSVLRCRSSGLRLAFDIFILIQHSWRLHQIFKRWLSCQMIQNCLSLERAWKRKKLRWAVGAMRKFEVINIGEVDLSVYSLQVLSWVVEPRQLWMTSGKPRLQAMALCAAFSRIKAQWEQETSLPWLYVVKIHMPGESLAVTMFAANVSISKGDWCAWLHGCSLYRPHGWAPWYTMMTWMDEHLWRSMWTKPKSCTGTSSSERFWWGREEGGRYHIFFKGVFLLQKSV